MATPRPAETWRGPRIAKGATSRVDTEALGTSLCMRLAAVRATVKLVTFLGDAPCPLAHLKVALGRSGVDVSLVASFVYTFVGLGQTPSFISARVAPGSLTK